MYLIISGSLLWKGWSNCLLFFGLAELPTFILALGSVVPPLRSDYGFGAAMLAFRVFGFGALLWVFHIGLPAELSHLPTIGIPPLLMHITWMRDWAVGVRKRAAEAAGSAEKKPAAADGAAADPQPAAKGGAKGAKQN